MLIIEASEVISAPLERVWDLVANPHRQAEFVSYEVTQVTQTNACDLGPEFQWNERGVLLRKRYECACRIFGWEPPQWFCFGTTNLFHVSFELESGKEGVELLYRVELPQTPESRREALAETCRQTLHKLKQLLEAQGRPAAT